MTKSPKVASDTGASVTVPPFDSTPLILAKALTVFEKSKLAETLDHLPAFDDTAISCSRLVFG